MKKIVIVMGVAALLAASSGAYLAYAKKSSETSGTRRESDRAWKKSAKLVLAQLRSGDLKQFPELAKGAQKLQWAIKNKDKRAAQEAAEKLGVSRDLLFEQLDKKSHVKEARALKDLKNPLDALRSLFVKEQ